LSEFETWPHKKQTQAPHIPDVKDQIYQSIFYETGMLQIVQDNKKSKY